MSIRLLLAACALIVLSSHAPASDWPQWRGPARDGVARGFTAPASWPEKLRRVWSIEVGGGYSSPVVSGSRAYVHSRRDENEIVQCVDLESGKSVWTASYAASFDKNQYAVQMGKGPNSTPVLHAGSLFTFGVTAILSCFDASDGELRWRRDFSKQMDTSRLFCGTAMSPLIDGESLIVHVGDDRGGSILALDPRTGDERWSLKGDGPGYASPIIAEIKGSRQIITLTDRSIVGVAAESGKLLWSLPFRDEWNENISTPAFHNGTLFVSGIRRGTMAVRVSRTGGDWSARQLWHNRRIAMYMNSPVVVGKHIYGLSASGHGQYFCLDATTGQPAWLTTGREGKNAAFLLAGELFLILTNDGDLIVAKSSPTGFESLARYTVADSPTWAHPVLAGNRILIKDDTHLSLWSF